MRAYQVGHGRPTRRRSDGAALRRARSRRAAAAATRAPGVGWNGGGKAGGGRQTRPRCLPLLRGDKHYALLMILRCSRGGAAAGTSGAAGEGFPQYAGPSAPSGRPPCSRAPQAGARRSRRRTPRNFRTHCSRSFAPLPRAAAPTQGGDARRKGLFRPPGAPAGTWPHTPWHHCVFCDPYERVNFWSHFVPGVALAVTGLLAYCGVAAGGEALWVFCCCSAATHLLSALTHVWPDDHFLEKLDHVGIVALIVGTPYSQMMALDPAADRSGLLVACGALLAVAFLPPLARTVGFVSVGSLMVHTWWAIVDVPLFLQCLLYVAGGVAFVRNGGHDRMFGLADHHLLHYKVTLACGLHVFNILRHTHWA